MFIILDTQKLMVCYFHQMNGKLYIFMLGSCFIFYKIILPTKVADIIILLSECNWVNTHMKINMVMFCVISTNLSMRGVIWLGTATQIQRRHHAAASLAAWQGWISTAIMASTKPTHEVCNFIPGSRDNGHKMQVIESDSRYTFTSINQSSSFV